jgi:copper homeostasis protein
MPPLIEVCVDSLDSALTAQALGADRLELCANLPIGGTTPSPGLLRLARQRVSLPLHVLVRPRGGDFVYSSAEIETMLADIAFAKAAGADSIVCGALTEEGCIDESLTRVLIEAAAPLPFTFHRAFDVCVQPLEGLRVLAGLGAARVLTSGQAPSAAKGLPLLQDCMRASGGVIIMPGGGITPDNISAVLSLRPAEIHFSGTVRVGERLVLEVGRLGEMIRVVRESEPC